MYSKKQMLVFEILDEIIETDKPQGMELKRYINQHEHSLRTRCKRNFGSLDIALTAYGYEIKTYKEISFERVFDYLDCCFEVNIDGHLKVDFEVYLRKITELQAMNYDVCPYRILRQVADEYALDRIEEFTKHNNEYISTILDDRPRRYPYNQIETLISQFYGKREELYKTYGVTLGMLPGANANKLIVLTSLGKEFELLVDEIFIEAQISHRRHDKVGDAIPDFISGNTWLDAKLSKSTALNPSCNTIEKYRQHTDYLVIIYAIDDTNATDDRATFVHVSEYYPYISEELQRKVDAFIRRATAVRFGGVA